jgi:2-polyprenyl-3-methyl-5-hydroxy-6-metoxy-1,4-benzoquinol methylase
MKSASEPRLPDSTQPLAEKVLTPRDLSRIARQVFRGGRTLLRTLQHYRPYICPFGELLEFVPRGSSILDVGCGGGLWLALLRETGRISRGVGFDSSAKAIELARTLEPGRGTAALEFSELPAQADWPGGPFDVVSIIDVLHHVPRDVGPELFRRAAARLKPGGILLYKDMYPGSWRSLCNRLHDLVLARQLINLVPTPRVIGWAKDAGFELKKSATFEMWWYGHVLCVFEKT